MLLSLGVFQTTFQYSLEELAEIEGTLKKHITPFIEYDIDVTKGGRTSFLGSEFPVEGEGETKRPKACMYSLTICELVPSGIM